jgi:hypothetical protein
MSSAMKQRFQRQAENMRDALDELLITGIMIHDQATPIPGLLSRLENARHLIDWECESVLRLLDESEKQ